jgi:hypothetical protein
MPLASANPTPFGLERHRFMTSGSAEAIDFVSKLITRCDLYHKCLENTKTDLPTRLLRIGPGPETDFQLIETASLPAYQDRRYVALSYCWGGVLPLRLLKSVYNEFRRKIPFSKLPTLFQECAELVRRSLEERFNFSGSTLCVLSRTLYKTGKWRHLGWPTSIKMPISPLPRPPLRIRIIPF